MSTLEAHRRNRAEPSPERTVWVGNIPAGFDYNQIKEAFVKSSLPAPAHVAVRQGRSLDKYAICTFHTRQHAADVLSWQGVDRICFPQGIYATLAPVNPRKPGKRTRSCSERDLSNGPQLDAHLQRLEEQLKSQNQQIQELIASHARQIGGDYFAKACNSGCLDDQRGLIAVICLFIMTLTIIPMSMICGTTRR